MQGYLQGAPLGANSCRLLEGSSISRVGQKQDERVEHEACG